MAKKSRAHPKPKIRTVYYPADDVQEIAEELIPEYHGTLRNAVIEYVAKTREDDAGVIQPARADDAKRFGRVQVASVPDQRMHKWQFRIVVNGNWWEQATQEERVGAVDTLLAYCWLKENRPVKVRPDVDGVFVGVYRRRGAWSKELREFEGAMAQQTLALDGAAAGPGEG